MMSALGKLIMKHDVNNLEPRGLPAGSEVGSPGRRQCPGRETLGSRLVGDSNEAFCPNIKIKLVIRHHGLPT